jgi:ArsR family transcriptional regulator
MVLLLLQRDLCVCELTSILEMEQSQISHQLRVLRNAELVEDIRDGKWIIYRVSENKKKDLNLIFERIIGDHFADSEEITKDQKQMQASQISSIRNCPTSLKGETIR